MMKMLSPHGEWYSESAATVLELAESVRLRSVERKLGIMLFGSVAVLYLCDNLAQICARRSLTFNDVDFFARREDIGAFNSLLEGIGFKENAAVRFKYAKERRLFENPKSGMRIDVFLDRFHMNHEFTPIWRGAQQRFVVTPADFLLEKLQIMRITEKDLLLLLAVLGNQPVAEGSGREDVTVRRLVDVLARDWGFWRTSCTNLLKAREFVRDCGLEADLAMTCSNRIDQLLKKLYSCRKSLRWRVRALIGERLKWYDDVDGS